MNTDPLYELSPCTLGGVEGLGWARYEDSTFTNNLVGTVYFDPEKAEEVKQLFDADRTAVYSGTVYFGRNTEHSEATVELLRHRSRSTHEPAKLRQPYLEGHPCIEFLGPGNPFNSDPSA